MSSKYQHETVTSVHHWNDTLFSFTTTRDPGFRYKNGFFTMIGLEVANKPLVRAYSMVSANYEDQLEFFSIKVQDGALTSRLQHLKVGDTVLVGAKPTGTLVAENLLPGKYLYLLGTGTGLAPFMSIIKDPEVYDLYEKVVLVHGVRYLSELAYQDFIARELPEHEFLGEIVRDKLLYYPTVTREPHRFTGRVTDLLLTGKIQRDLGLPALNVENDRFMLCGSPSMLKDTCRILNDMGYTEARHGNQGHYVVERAFVE
ncbi:MAG: ferredoxin--NADP reductase [Pseudomonadales bacterium]|jgi:ferredoxin--NADP+ reductase|nr:ferredoxin--NADP reductase [Pseudomonadales bacterium]